jgi:hypothetical protein
MPAAVAPASRGHNVFSNAFGRGRSRSRAASEVGPQSPPTPARGPEVPQMTKAASYTYFPRVKDLDTPPVVELKGTISAEELHLQPRAHGEGTSESSGGSSPSSEEAPEIEAVEMPQLRPSNISRRSSRFLPSFSSKSREPSTERKSEKSDRKAERGRKEEVRQQTESPSSSPARSMSKLRRKSWIVSESKPRKSESSPSREKLDAKKEQSTKKSQEANKRKTASGSTVSIPETSEARDAAPEPLQPVPLSKKNKRLSGLFNATANIPPVPAVPKSFSTEKLPLNTHQQFSPTSPNAVPPLPRNVSHENFKGVKTEPRKKDELWNVFRTLDADLRK